MKCKWEGVLVGNISLYNLTLLWEAPNGFLKSMLRLLDLHHHKQTFAIWSCVLLGLTSVRFIWQFNKWNTIYMQNSSKVARCLNGTLLISWSIFFRSYKCQSRKESWRSLFQGSPFLAKGSEMQRGKVLARGHTSHSSWLSHLSQTHLHYVCGVRVIWRGQAGMQ